MPWRGFGIGWPTRLWHSRQSIVRGFSLALIASMSGSTSSATVIWSWAMYSSTVPSTLVSAT